MIFNAESTNLMEDSSFKIFDFILIRKKSIGQILNYEIQHLEISYFRDDTSRDHLFSIYWPGHSCPWGPAGILVLEPSCTPV